jgi:T5SS/PEP-CTERM-associated repeat protein/autotransporter-associated beta strand protein
MLLVVPAWAELTVVGDLSPADPNTWTSSTFAYVGNTAYGSLTVDGSSNLPVGRLHIGCNSGVLGEMTVTGGGSTVTDAGLLYVGYNYGIGRLRITAGAKVSNTTGYLGAVNGSSGEVTVDGDGSSWTNTGNLSEYVGYSGLGTLSINNGGVVSGKSTFIAYNNTASGSYAHVSGNGSTWTATNFYVGYLGSASLLIDNGGVVNSGAGYIGNGSSSTGIATVNGSGSTWNLGASILTVGVSGTGTLNLNYGGKVCANTVKGTAGTINFDGGVLQAYNASNASWISGLGASGSGVFLLGYGAIFDTQNYNMGIPIGIQHGGFSSTDGGLTKIGGGKLTLTGSNTYTGRTTLQQGTLQLGPNAYNAVLNLGGTDIQAGTMIFDYAGSASPAGTIQSLLTASYNGGAWNTGQFICTTADAMRGLGWLDDVGAQLVRVQYASYGDADLNGAVDSDDLLILLSKLGSSSAVWGDGDFDYNGTVNSDDLLALLSGLGSSAKGMRLVYGGTLDPDIAGMLSAGGITVVPEPGTLMLLTFGCLGTAVVVCVRRRRSSRGEYSMFNKGGVMTKYFIALVAIMAWFVSTAEAEMLSVDYTGPVSISAELNAIAGPTSPIYDVITLRIKAISGSPSSTDKVTALVGGQWRVTGSAAVNGFYLPGTSSQWQAKTTSSVQDFSELESITSTCFNFTSTTGKLFDGVISAFRTTTSAPNVYSSFGNTWYSGDPQLYLPVNSEIGILFVTKNWTTITFEDFNPANPAKIGGMQFVKAFETLSISNVPEPSSLALLAGGSLVLLAHARRKRK